MSSLVRRASLCSWKLMSGLLIPKCFKRIEDRLVSSAATSPTIFKTSSARNVMSPRFPIGDPIRKSKLPPLGKITCKLRGNVLDRQWNCLAFLGGYIIADKKAADAINIFLTKNLAGS